MTGQDNGTMKSLIEIYGYRVPKEILIEFMSIYGIVVSKVAKQLFVDGSDPYVGSDGTNHSGTFSMKFKLSSNISQLLLTLSNA